MMYYLKGDLFTTLDKVIVHGCNAQGKMRSGIAEYIRISYPEVYDDYWNGFKYGGVYLGNIIITKTKDNRIIISAITQEYYGSEQKRYASYDAIDVCFEKINTFCVDSNIDRISIPKIGAGLGGGDWNVIDKIISSQSIDITTTVYEF